MDQISLFDYLNPIASNIDINQYIDDDFVVDFEEEENNVLNARRSAESLPEI